ncbi:MAG: FAD-binding monooxygenase, partial [Caulobacterales bacterium]|nr:FAD-binding monooxygenase [Caulobacterales bacterium]
HEPAAAGLNAPDGLPEETDVLVVGCGPAGLTLAAQLSHFPQIRTCVVEQKPGPLERGQADGLSCRSMEMFQAFGFADKIKREAYWVNETTFWNPHPERPQEIARSGRIQDVEDGLSEMPHVILNQARVHDRYLEIMLRAPTRLTPFYSTKLIGLEILNDGSDHPVIVTLQHGEPGREGEPVTIRARYVVGCDGARSSVRGAIGRELTGDRANQAWGVMDILAVTDFPDIRLKTLIKSSNEGNIIIIPREGGHLVRIYIEMDKLSDGQRISTDDVTVDQLIGATNRVLRPYAIDVKEVAWWSIYEVGHRLTDKFDDVPAGQADTRAPRVFIAGDACHTHSAKAGQGMNVSMGDAFNLGWKLVSVLLGRCEPSLLHSYSVERHKVAKALIDFDHEWSRIIGARPEAAESGQDTPKFQRYFIEHGRYTAGLSVQYEPSELTGAPSWRSLATGFEIGTRFHSAPVIRAVDAKPMQLGHVIEADCRWRLFAFAGPGDPSDAGSGVGRLCRFLAEASDSPVRKYTPSDADLDSIIDVRAIFPHHHRDINIGALPELLKPFKGRLRLRDYEKVFAPDLRQGDIYTMRGVDRERGCIVIVRPDQYVSHVLPLDGFAALASFFDGFMVARS